MTYGDGPWQAPGAGQSAQAPGAGQPGYGHEHGQAPGHVPGTEHGQTAGAGQNSGAWTAPGKANGNSNAIWWIVGIVCAVGVIMVAGAVIALAVVVEQSMKSGSGPYAAPRTTSSPFAPAVRPTASIPTARPDPPEGQVSPSIREAPRFPRVQPAAELPREDAAALGVEVDIQTSELRYLVMDVLDQPIYHCIFSVDVQNLTDQPVSVTAAFRPTGDPRVESAGTPLTKLEPYDSSEVVRGWDGRSPAEVALSEDECTGRVELTELVVAPG